MAFVRALDQTAPSIGSLAAGEPGRQAPYMEKTCRKQSL
jgi:hypothetical protein